jgi:hypothetical protein
METKMIKNTKTAKQAYAERMAAALNEIEALKARLAAHQAHFEATDQKDWGYISELENVATGALREVFIGISE